LFGERFDFSKPLGWFTSGKIQGVVGATVERPRDRHAVQLPNILGGDDKKLTRVGRHELGYARETASLDNRFVSALWRFNTEAGHRTALLLNPAILFCRASCAAALL